MIRQAIIFSLLIIFTALLAIGSVEVKNRGIISPTTPPEPVDTSFSLDSIISPSESETSLQGSLGGRGSFENRISQAIAAEGKYSTDDLKVEIKRSIGDYYSGSFYVNGNNGSRLFYAVDTGKGIVVILAESGLPFCSRIEEHDFPIRIIPECFDESTGETVRRTEF